MERDRLKLAILGHVLPFCPFALFEKMKKKTGDIILLHMYTINKDNMIVLYGF